MKKIADALELLTAQHEQIIAGLSDAKQLRGDTLVRALGELADMIATHLVAEAELRTNLGMRETTDREQLMGSVTEILTTELDSAEMRAGIHTLEQQFRDHATSQDQEFMALATLLEDETLVELGAQLNTIVDTTEVIRHA